VWEWCADYWHPNYKEALEDERPWMDVNAKESIFRLLRGGSWYNHPRGCRSACRSHHLPDSRRNYVGFRVCCLPQD
jgi:formylglycine-generating enzyme required for sulfatase activity